LSQIIKPLTSSGPIPPVIPTSFTTDAGIATPALNNINVFGGAGTKTSGSGSTITINVVNDGFPWSDEAVSFAAASQNGYFCTGSLTATLPLTAGLANGATIIFYVDTFSQITILAQADQTINLSNNLSILGGTCKSLSEGATLTLTFRIADAGWHAISSLGSWITT
jgi:hypothetical protein